MRGEWEWAWEVSVHFSLLCAIGIHQESCLSRHTILYKQRCHTKNSTDNTMPNTFNPTLENRHMEHTNRATVMTPKENALNASNTIRTSAMSKRDTMNMNHAITQSTKPNPMIASTMAKSDIARLDETAPQVGNGKTTMSKTNLNNNIARKHEEMRHGNTRTLGTNTTKRGDTDIDQYSTNRVSDMHDSDEPPNDEDIYYKSKTLHRICKRRPRLLKRTF